MSKVPSVYSRMVHSWYGQGEKWSLTQNTLGCNFVTNVTGIQVCADELDSGRWEHIIGHRQS